MKIKYVPEQLIDITAIPIIFLLMFTYLFGGAISGSTGQYLDFLLPGSLVMTIAMITMYTGVDLNKDIEKGIFDRFRTLPFWRPAALVGAFLADSLRYLMALTIMIALGYLLGFRPENGFIGLLLGVLILLLFAFSVSWIWTCVALIVRSEKTVLSISTFSLMPFTFFSSIFVDPATMPNWLQKFVRINPITLVVDAVRGLSNGTVTSGQIFVVLIVSASLIIIFAPLTMYLYKNKK